VVIVQSEANLLQVVLAGDATRGLTGRLNGRQEQGHEHSYDEDHHKQLDERKTV
jgi:hypothetical protein